MYQDYYLPPVRQSSVTSMESRKNAEKTAQSLYESTYKREDFTKKVSEFKTDVKTYFLKEAMSKVIVGALPDSIDESYVNMSKSLVENFIKDEGVDTLLKRFSTTSVFLAEMSGIVTESYNSVMEACKDCKDLEELLIRPSDNNEFFDKLSNMDTEEMSRAIASKVADAESEFIQANVRDRETMETLAQETKDKVENYRSKNADVTESVRLGYEQEYKRKVSDLSRRPKGILESMVYRASNSIMSNNDLRAAYLNEDGMLNTDKIINTCEVMYTLLEMVNTAKMKVVDEAYIESVIKGIG